MAKDTFVAFVLEQLAEVQGLECRAMFGAHGLYAGAAFFGIVSDGKLYLKTDDFTAANYTRLGMRPFRPNDRQVLKTYFEVPADVLESRTELCRWAEAATRCAGTRPPPGSRRGVRR